MDGAPKAHFDGRHRLARVSRIAWLAPYMILGPVSGPLTAGVVQNIRGGRPVLASMYGFVLTGWLALAPIEVIHLLPAALAHFL